MEASKELKGKSKDTWQRLFGSCFRPKNVIELEMSKRYVLWFEMFEVEQEAVRKDGGQAAYNNGTNAGQSPHWKCMIQAEGEMRRLWEQLSKSITTPKDDTNDLGQFADL